MPRSNQHKRIPLEERFQKFFIRTDGCWNWLGSKNKFGYGLIKLNSKKYAFAHRIAWSLVFGEIPQGMFICHKCDNTSCVRLDHLFLGTPKDNIDDCRAKGRANYAKPKGYHRVSEEKQNILGELYLYAGARTKDLVEIFKISQAVICRIFREKGIRKYERRTENDGRKNRCKKPDLQRCLPKEI